MKLEFKNIQKSFGDNYVLKGISFTAESGNAFGLLGRNGAGKTTSIRILMGVFEADAGEVLLDGEPIDRSKIKFGYLPEERGLYPKRVIIEQLSYFGQLKGLSKNEALSAAGRWLERMSMNEYKDKKLDTLSKGNQQKIQLIAALISDPDIVVLDEPFSGLDPVNAMLLKDVIKEVIAQGKIVLFSSHQMNYIEEFCDNIAILNGGKIALSGHIDDIKKSYDRTLIIVESEDAMKISGYLKEQCELDGNKVRVRIESENKKNELLSELSKGGFDIDSVKVYEPSLSDIFVQYTSENNR